MPIWGCILVYVCVPKCSLNFNINLMLFILVWQSLSEKLSEFTEKLEDVCDKLTLTENRLIGHQPQADNAGCITDLQQYQQEHQVCSSSLGFIRQTVFVQSDLYQSKHVLFHDPLLLTLYCCLISRLCKKTYWQMPVPWMRSSPVLKSFWKKIEASWRQIKLPSSRVSWKRLKAKPNSSTSGLRSPGKTWRRL